MKKKIVPIVSLLLAIFFGFTLTQNEQKLLEEIVSEPDKVATPVLSRDVNSDELFDVVRIADGDTITISMDGVSEKIRFIGIDTPEIGNVNKPSDCLAEEAKKEMESVLEGHQVRLEFDETQGERDKYGRLLAYVYLDEGTFLNRLMIQKGFAHEYTYQKKYKYVDDFMADEDKAQFEEIGIWNTDICIPELRP